MRSCWAKEKVKETNRVIKVNDSAFNTSLKYANNYIKTSKYTVFTFLPKNLFEQFQRLANAYFLFLLILQLMPWITSLTSITTIIPLVAVISLTAIKDVVDDILIPQISSLTPLATVIPLIAVLSVTVSKDGADDLQRHYSDNQVNNRLSWVLRNGKLVEEKWKYVVVGDIIKMENDHFVAADLLILSTSEPNSLCYIETAELDGETNLKVKQALPVTAELSDDLVKMSALKGDITCEPPNNNLNRFEGVIHLGEEKYSLNNDKILLRGCVLRNTQWCYGLVIFAGKDTKLMMNSGQAVFKRTNIDRLLNILIIGIFIFLLCSCLFCTLSSILWEALNGYDFQAYLPWEDFVPQVYLLAGSVVISLLGFLSYIIVFNTVVPISLYVSIEMIRFAHSYWINWDKEMYYAKTDTPAKARTTTLNEELGQIEYIFSDKTGTLTQNIMTFNKCSINGCSYGDALDEDGNILPTFSGTPKVDFSFNPLADTTFCWYDQRLLSRIKLGDKKVQEFFRLLALCHTVMVENKDGLLKYQAQSPDENALVSAARNFGFVFTARSPNSITIQVNGHVEDYELLSILDFNNVRKRMSVIVKRHNKILLYCKGADSTIYERLAPSCQELKEITASHLEIKPLSQLPLAFYENASILCHDVTIDKLYDVLYKIIDYAGDGLRTLVTAFKEVSHSYYNDWQRRHHEASTSMINREEMLVAVYEEIEKDMILIGATAIEDKLQDRVPETIANLSLAGIKIWVLTGDKQETAVNVGYSCKLLTDDLEDIYVVDGDTMDIVECQLLKARQDMIRRLGVDASPQVATDNNSDEVDRACDVKQKRPIKQNLVINVGSPESSVFASDDLTTVSFAPTPPTHKRQESISSQKSVTADDMPEDFGGFAIIVNGHSLVHALTEKLEMLLLEVGCMCKAVICCRVTPLQKALVVDLVKRHKKTITLAIGDGANDVNMIKTAHIGVGISGQEGMQAVLASDFAIGQFRFLQRLLLVHGRYSYLRICRFLRYFFYKNFAFTLCHFWFAFVCGYSAQSLYDEAFVSLYNVCYSSLPILVLGIFEKDVNEYYSLKYPKLYTPGHIDLFFNKIVFCESVCEGILMSVIIFVVTYGTYHSATTPSGLDLSDHHSFGFVVGSILIVAVTLRCALDTVYWTGFNHFVIWGSIIFYFVFTYVFYIDYFEYSYMGTASMVMSTPQFWLTLCLGVTAVLLPVVVIRFYRIETRPTLSHKLRVRQQMLSKTKSGELIQRKHSLRRSMQSFRKSGYAFSHMEGFGHLITTGTNMTPEQRSSRFSSLDRPSSFSRVETLTVDKQSSASDGLDEVDRIVEVHYTSSLPQENCNHTMQAVASENVLSSYAPTDKVPLSSNSQPLAPSSGAQTRSVKSEPAAVCQDAISVKSECHTERAGKIVMEMENISPTTPLLATKSVEETKLHRPSILKTRTSDTAAKTPPIPVDRGRIPNSPNVTFVKRKSAHFASADELDNFIDDASSTKGLSNV